MPIFEKMNNAQYILSVHAGSSLLVMVDSCFLA